MPLYTTEAGLSRRENEGRRKKVEARGCGLGRWGAVAWFVLGAGLTGCGVADVAWGYTCDDFVPGRTDALGRPQPCPPDVGPDASAGPVDPDGCAGECSPFGNEDRGWMKPFLRWVGERGKAPACPGFADVPGPTYYTDLVSPPKECGHCSCESPNGSCGPPKTIKAHAASCQELYQIPPQTSFDPPQDWDGTCTTANPVDAGLPCPGGVDCVQSLTFSELEIIEEPCQAITMEGPAAPDPYWTTEVSTCWRFTFDACTDGRACLPAPPPDFQYCIAKRVEAEDGEECPEGYPDQEVYYYQDYDDQRCSPCGCDPPAGSTCSGCIGIYSDSTCSMMRECQSVSSYQPQPACTDIMPSGIALLSKQAFLTYTPGACQPYGQEPGTAVPAKPRRFCCRGPGIAK